MRRRLAAAAGLCLVLPGCEQGATVTVRQEAGGITVAATRTRSSKPACVADLTVYRADAAASTPLWHIAAAPEAACIRRVTLGAVPLSFAGDPVGALRLVPGTPYRVEVAGNGFTGTARFTVAR